MSEKVEILGEALPPLMINYQGHSVIGGASAASKATLSY